MKKTVLLNIWFLAAALVFNCSQQDQSYDRGAVIPVSVEEVELNSIREFVNATGTVQALKEAVLLGETAGYYRLEINPKTGKKFAMGDRVSKDQVIAYLDNPERENEIKIESKELNLETTQREFEKQKSLYEKGGVTLSEFKTAEANYINARYDLENANIQLAKLKIGAPFSGILVDLTYYTEDTKLNANVEIARLMDYVQLHLEMNLPNKQMGRVSVGQKLLVYHYASAKDTLQGRISQVAPTLDPDSRTFKVCATVNNPNLLLRPGMFVQADIITAEKDSVIVIPKDVVLQRQNSKIVYIVRQGSIAHDRKISTGIENRSQFEVTDGLSAGDRLIVKGFETLRDRSKVKIIK
ncbi:efflux RND transporter periplasmic adaptor subunit [candidate division KSB1 bacterium]|nr:efflux RND transporter periplasmic adaptor subunit [candidate division KSB1 bacterium]